MYMCECVCVCVCYDNVKLETCHVPAVDDLRTNTSYVYHTFE